MKSKKLIPTDRPSVNAIPVYQEQYNKLWYDLFEGGGALDAVSMTLSGDLTVSGTTTLNGNLVLGDAAADTLTINATTTYEAPIDYSNQTGITAFATGGQASATALTEEINNVTTCATAGDSVKLPAAVAGKHIWIKNSGAAALDIFPASSDSINALAANLAIRIQPGSSIHLYAKDATVWETENDTSITIPAPSTLKGGLEVKAADSAGNTITTITNASQAAARTYTIPDAGAAASFVMTEGAQTINGVKTLGSGLTGIAGAAGTPSFNFVGALTTGLMLSSANAMGVVTNGTERWVYNSSGHLVPVLANTYNVGSAASPVADVWVAASVRNVHATTFGTVGAAEVTAAHYGDGRDITTVLTLTNFIIGPLAGAAAAKVLVPATALFTFPAGSHVLMVSSTSLGLTAAGTAVTPDVGLGSVAGDGSANATLNLSAAGAEDILTGYAIADTVTHAAVASGPIGATAGMLTGIALNNASGVKTVYLNAAASWNADNTGNLTATGTVVIKWTIM